MNVVQLLNANPTSDPAGTLAPEITFDDFWDIYPRRVAKAAARKAWAKINPKLHVEILESLLKWRRVWLSRGELEFVPHASTWLNGERWEDELPAPVQSLAAAHMPAHLPPQAPRGEMPSHIRDALAKLRERRS